MGSLITALQNQNIAAANQETLGDIYAANPTNLGYTDNPFEYTAAPAVVQTAYPKYGYNATAPMMPPSYEDYDLTTLFSMLQGMQQDGQPQSFTAPVPTVAPMAEGQAPATPAGILAAMSAQPLSGAYRVPGTEPVVTEPEQEDAQAASDERIRQLIAENASNQQRRELEQRYKKVTGLPVNPNQSNWDLRQVLDDPSSPYNVTE
jgi:hypothetical protein